MVAGGDETGRGGRTATGTPPRRRTSRRTRSRSTGGRRLMIIETLAGASVVREPRARDRSSVAPAFARNRAKRLPRAGAELGRPAGTATAGRIGKSPTIEWILSGIAGPVGQPQLVVVERVGLVPQARWLIAPRSGRHVRGTSSSRSR